MNNQEEIKKEEVAETQPKQEFPNEQEINHFNNIIQKLNDIEAKFSEISFTNKNVELQPQEETKTIKEEFKLG